MKKKQYLLKALVSLPIYFGLASASNAQMYQVCLATNLYEDAISHVTEGPSPAAALEGLLLCVKDSVEGKVDGCQCTVDCSPGGVFMGARAASLINQLIIDKALDMKQCKRD